MIVPTIKSKSGPAPDNCGSVFAQTFGYDQYDNMWQSGSYTWACSTCYNLSTNQYNSSVGTVSYDSNGDLTSDTHHNYAWNEFGKLKSVDASGANCSTGGECIVYDAFGRAVEVDSGSTYTQTWYTQSSKLYMNGSTYLYSYWPAPGGATALHSNANGVQFLHKDWLGNARITSNLGTTVVADNGYAPYGESYNGYGSSAVNLFMFTGLTQDIISGECCYDTPNREYASGQGRWLSPDPAGAGWNQYAYPTNPNSFTDPSGLMRMLPGQCDSEVYDCSGGNPGGDFPFGDGIYIGGEGVCCGGGSDGWGSDGGWGGWGGGGWNPAAPTLQSIFSGQDCLTCFPTGPNAMQILQAILSGNYWGALQGFGIMPPMTNCLPICDATTNQDGYWVGQRNGEVYCDPVSGACTVWDAKAGTWGVCDSACQLSNEMNKVWYGTDPCSDGQWLMNAGENTQDLAYLGGLVGLLYPPLVPASAIAGGIGLAEKRYGKYMRSSNGC